MRGGNGIITSERIRDALAEGPDWHSAGAVSWSLGEGASGTFGTDPAPEVADRLTGLVETGEVQRRRVCPGCGRPGDLYALASRVPTAADEDPPAILEGEIDEAMEPLVAEGLIEVSELIEVERRECCERTGRAWRRTPPPA